MTPIIIKKTPYSFYLLCDSHSIDDPPQLFPVNNLLANLPTPKPQIHHHGTYTPVRQKTPAAAPNPPVGPKLPFEDTEVSFYSPSKGITVELKNTGTLT